MTHDISWPNGKKFAFTVVDDTDLTTLECGPPVYDFLYDHGFLTTKTVWPVKGAEVPLVGGSTCEEPDYLKWVQELASKGFEIALHNATYHTSSRSTIIKGLDDFKTYFGADPKIHVNHYGCKDALYWGEDRLTSINKAIYNLMTGFRRVSYSTGHVVDSTEFWGDLSASRIKYVRNFVYPEINTLKTCPQMPYHDRKRPYVNYWFASSEGADRVSYNKLLQEKHQDRLEAEGGACIMYTHFGKGFYENGRLNDEFKTLMQRLSQKDGWFVPASTLLDFLLQQRTEVEISDWERMKLESKWLVGKVLVGGSS